MQGTAIVRHVVTFGRVLREVGIEVGPGRVADAVRGLGAVDLTTTGRRLLHPPPDARLAPRRARALRPRVRRLVSARPRRAARAPEADAPLRRSGRARHARVRVGRRRGGRFCYSARARRLRPRAPAREGLRRDDAGGVRARTALDGRDRRTRPRRTSRRRSPDPRGDRLDIRRLLRKSLRTGGEPIEQPWKARKTVPRKLVVLCDISGSMDAYARALLFFLHAIVGTGHGVEAFAFGTRLTRLTPDLATRDPEAALARANESAVDWGSGTRIGASLGEFNDDLRAASAVARRRRRNRLRRLGARGPGARRP